MLIDFTRCFEQRQGLFHIIKICYEYAFFAGRKQAGLSLRPSEESRLVILQHLLEENKLRPTRCENRSVREKRRLRRFPVPLQVSLKIGAGQRQGTLLNISGEGMFIAIREVLPVGTRVQVRLGTPGDVEYIFFCQVKWTTLESHGGGCGLSFSGIPLEVRYQKALRASA